MAQRKDQFGVTPTSEFNVLSPVTLSDAEEDASQSHNQNEMATKECCGQSGDEDGAEDDGNEEETEEVEAVPEPVQRHRPK
jgi:hypothetical protein